MQALLLLPQYRLVIVTEWTKRFGLTLPVVFRAWHGAGRRGRGWALRSCEPGRHGAYSCGAVADFHRLPEHPDDCCG